jgi:hypothetical protein
MEPIIAVAWAFSTVSAIANSDPGKKFIEGMIGTLAEKITGEGLTKVEHLRKVIVLKLQGNPAAVEALAKVETCGTEDDFLNVANYLDMAARKDAAFDWQVQSLVREIRTCVAQGNDAIMQNNYDNARGVIVKAAPGSNVYIVDRMINPD